MLVRLLKFITAFDCIGYFETCVGKCINNYNELINYHCPEHNNRFKSNTDIEYLLDVIVVRSSVNCFYRFDPLKSNVLNCVQSNSTVNPIFKKNIPKFAFCKCHCVHFKSVIRENTEGQKTVTGHYFRFFNTSNISCQTGVKPSEK